MIISIRMNEKLIKEIDKIVKEVNLRSKDSNTTRSYVIRRLITHSLIRRNNKNK